MTYHGPTTPRPGTRICRPWIKPAPLASQPVICLPRLRVRQIDYGRNYGDAVFKKTLALETKGMAKLV